jgi:aspartyl-tRNA(Asn)/glutamyl-tRNA(Gln) amidotransferase subunit C
MDNSEFDILAKVSRLKLSDDEAESIKKSIDEIIEYFNEIDNVDCEGLEPAYQPVVSDPKLRNDEIKKFEDYELLLKNFKKNNGYVLGPKL